MHELNFTPRQANSKIIDFYQIILTILGHKNAMPTYQAPIHPRRRRRVTAARKSAMKKFMDLLMALFKCKSKSGVRRR